MGRKTLLLVNATKSEAAQAASEIRELVRHHGQLLGELPADSSPLPPEFKGAELYVVLGGDGTLLAQSRRCASPKSAMLGVNLGRLGYLAAFDLKSIRSQATELFGLGPLKTSEYNLLNIEVSSKGHREAHFSAVALNDAVITAGPPYRLITLTLCLNGKDGPSIRGDGLIIASPVGSTAYNLSAGGPVIDPSVDALAITPIAPQSLSFRPIVVDGDCTVEVTLVKTNAGAAGQGTTLVLDGQIQAPLKAGDKVRITKHDHGIRFVINEKSDWWSRLINRLQWASTPRMS